MHEPSEMTKLIHENLWIVASYAFAQPAIEKVLKAQFQGSWAPLHKTIYTNAEKRADRALLEMATQLRVLDDAKSLSATLKIACGRVTKANGKVAELSFREMANKVIHGTGYEWRLSDPIGPTVVITPSKPDLWTSAEISVVAVMAVVGALWH
jgi:hypothetical protein